MIHKMSNNYRKIILAANLPLAPNYFTVARCRQKNTRSASAIKNFRQFIEHVRKKTETPLKLQRLKLMLHFTRQIAEEKFASNDYTFSFVYTKNFRYFSNYCYTRSSFFFELRAIFKQIKTILKIWTSLTGFYICF